MALTARRWIGIALLGAAAIAVAYLPPSPDWWTDVRGAGSHAYFGSGGTHEQTVARTLDGDQDQLGVLSRRDTLVGIVRALHPRAGAAPAVGFQGGWTEPQRARLRQMVADAWDTFGPTASDVAVAIVFRYDTHDARGYLARGNWYLLPGATGGSTCIVAASPFGIATSWPIGGVRSALGPCAYYGVFGRPGARVEEWLLQSNFWQAADADWLSPRSQASPLGDDESSISDASTGYLLEVIAALSWQGLGVAGAACATGDVAACRRIVLSSDGEGRMFIRKHRGRVPIVRIPNAYYGQGYDRWYLADLVREQGRDKFGRFWRAGLPPDSAFASVYGMSIEAWTRSWLREHSPKLHAGPGVRTASVLWGFVSIIAFVGIGAAFAQRRRIV